MRDFIKDSDLQFLITIQQLIEDNYRIGVQLGLSELCHKLQEIEQYSNVTKHEIESVVRRDMARHRQLYLPQILRHPQGGVKGTTPVTLTSVVRRRFLKEFNALSDKVLASELTERQAWEKFQNRLFHHYINHESFETLFIGTLEYAGYRIQDSTLITDPGLEGLAFKGNGEDQGWYGLEAKHWRKVKVGGGKSGISKFISSLKMLRDTQKNMDIKGGIFLALSGFNEPARKKAHQAREQGLNIILLEPLDLIDIWIKNGCVSFAERDPSYLLWVICNLSGSRTKM